MKKSELICAIAERSCLSKRDTDRAFQCMLDIMMEALLRGEKVQLTGFGTFEVKQRSGYKGYNPKKREDMVVAEYKTPVFKPSDNLKELLK